MNSKPKVSLYLEAPRLEEVDSFLDYIKNVRDLNSGEKEDYFSAVIGKADKLVAGFHYGWENGNRKIEGPIYQSYLRKAVDTMDYDLEVHGNLILPNNELLVGDLDKIVRDNVVAYVQFNENVNFETDYRKRKRIFHCLWKST